MQKPQKDLLRTLVTALRHLLVGYWDEQEHYHPGDLDRELERLGFGRDGAITALDAVPNPTSHDQRAYRVAEVQLAGLSVAQRASARAAVLERAAYSWINRLLALRAMEARGLIAETLRPNPAYEGISEALFILRHTEPARTHGADGGWWAVLEDACRAQAAHLPGLFDLADPNAALRPSTLALLRAIQLVGGGQQPGFSEKPGFSGQAAAELDAVLADPDAIGWAYQFYQQEAKDRVYAKLGKGGKVETRSEIAAATQLFTEPYMVQWLLQNSLGRSYHEAYPQSRLPKGWEYYIKPDKVTGGQGDKVKDGASPLSPPHLVTLSDLTLLDPSMGSGHFLRAGFDLLFAMYREQQPDLPAAEIAQRILSQHLFGIDIDPRAAQLAALTLVLRAWETIRTENTTTPFTQSPPHLVTLSLNLATTPTLAPGSLERHLALHPADEPYRPLLVGLFAALEQAPLLGSLLRPEEHLEAGLATFRQANRGQLGLLGASAPTNRLLEELAKHDPTELKRLLLERIGRSFAREAQASDVGAQLLGREASAGMHLLALLGRKYAVVATNPPYMGSKNMNPPLRTYVEKFYKSGKRDLYAAFILRCLELTHHAGRVAMVTQQSWMFLKSFADLRALPEEKLTQAKQKGEFGGLLRETCIEGLAHLGEHAFEEAAAAGAFAAMFTVAKRMPGVNHRIVAFRLAAIQSVDEKRIELLRVNSQKQQFEFVQARALTLDRSPLVYWLSTRLLDLFVSIASVKEIAYARQGICTTDNIRFLRFVWEVPNHQLGNRFLLFAKGGGVRRWAGFDQTVVDWQINGIRIKAFQEEKPGAIHWSGRMPDDKYLFRSGWTFTRVSRGTLALREIPNGSLFGHTSPALLVYENVHESDVGFWLNTRLATFLLRALTQSLNAQEGYVQRLPLPLLIDSDFVKFLTVLPLTIVRIFTSYDLTEHSFSPNKLIQSTITTNLILETYYLIIEGFREYLSFESLDLRHDDINLVVEETGTPSGWHPLIFGLDTFPEFPAINLPPIHQKILDYLIIHERITLTPSELARIKSNLKSFYEAGPGSKSDDLELKEGENDHDEEETTAGAYIPIPTETFLEELSVKLQIHPISVYWLLEELRAAGVRCKPEEKRLLEDRLTVLVLRLLGHRWPKQIEAGEPLPDWADRDGIIPLVGGLGETTLAERLRQRLRAANGDLAAQQSEALLYELTGRTLDEWLRRDFCKRHISQFKKRPIAWHLASTPSLPLPGGSRRGLSKKGPRREPVFECLVYYHACAGDILARIRTQYVEPLLAREERQVAQARQATLPGAPIDETAVALASARLHELRDFVARLRQVEESGFACPELEALVAAEPLDRWSGDGILPPTSAAALLAQEQAWRVDINDGVRVNIAPLQQAGLLAQAVLNPQDLRQAITDRARWRADERRWVRAGKLPRCGWLDEAIPESPRWSELAPERAAERQRLAEKRQKVLAELQGKDED